MPRIINGFKKILHKAVCILSKQSLIYFKFIEPVHRNLTLKVLNAEWNDNIDIRISHPDEFVSFLFREMIRIIGCNRSRIGVWSPSNSYVVEVEMTTENVRKVLVKEALNLPRHTFVTRSCV